MYVVGHNHLNLELEVLFWVPRGGDNKEGGMAHAAPMSKKQILYLRNKK